MNRCFLAVIAGAIALSSCGGGGGGSSAGGSSLPPPVTTPSIAPVGPTPTAAPSVTPSPAPTASPSATPLGAPTAPATYAALYSLVNANVQSFASAVGAQCPNPTFATRAVPELLNANSNFVINTLPGQSVAFITASAQSAIASAATMQRLLGVTSVEISINYPLLIQNPANFPNASWSVANYASFASYYQQVTAGLRALGLGVTVESNVIFPSFSTSGFTYSGLTTQQLAAGKAEQINAILSLVKPDYLNVETEPLTLSFNTGIASLNTPAGFAALVAAEVAGANRTLSPSTKLGAGSADWSDPAFITQLVAATTNSLDFYDLHLYPPTNLVPTANANAFLDFVQLKASGKPITVSENWLNKTDQSVDSAGQNPQIVEARNLYSFWQTLDAQYVPLVYKLAQCNNALFITYWDTTSFYAYVDYGPSTANLTLTQLQMMQQQSANAAIAAGVLSPSGAAFKALGH